MFSLGHNLSNCLLIERHFGSENAEFCNNKNITIFKTSGGVKNPQNVCLKKKQCSMCVVFKRNTVGMLYDYKVDQGIAGLNDLLSLLCSTNQKPDVQILQNIQILLAIEVHSSKSYEATIEKGIMTVVELLCLKQSFNKTSTSCMGFTFPKLPANDNRFHQCVVKIEVTWTRVKFLYRLTSIANISHVKVAVLDVCNKACLDSYTGEQQTKCTTVLTSNELQSIFGRDAIQVPSQSSTLIFVPSKEMWYKHPHGRSQIQTWMELKLSIQEMSSYIVNFDFSRIQGLNFIRYKTVLHDPLTFEEAKLCLFHFLRELTQTVKQSRQIGFAQQDIRLENVCFNEHYQPVLIDLDRARDNTLSPIIYGKLCMYVVDKSPTQIDWIQLGWLAT